MHTIEGAWDLARPRPARDPHGAWVTATYRLGPTHPCRHCGRVVRQAWWKGGRPECLLFVEGPIDPAGVSQRWMAWWWDDARPLQDRVARHDPEHLARGDLLFVMHPCEDPAYRPPPAVTASTAPPPAPPTREAPPLMTSPFGTPKPPGENVEKEELKGRLLLIAVAETIRDMPTKYGPSPAVRCNVACLDNGEEHADVLLFGKMLTQQLAAGISYLGRLTHQDGKNPNGNDWPWLFEGAQDDPAAVQTAQQYLAYKASQVAAAPVAAAPPAAAPAPAFPPAAVQAASPTAAAAPPWAA